MKLIDYYLLKENDKVIIYGKVKTVKSSPINGTIKAGNKCYYFNEVEKKV
jgi:hypothetical protein